MSQRARDASWVWPVSQLVLVLVGFTLVFSPFRQAFSEVRGLLTVGLILLMLVAIGTAIHRLASRSTPPPAACTNVDTLVSSPETLPPIPTQAAAAVRTLEIPQTTAQLITQLRFVDWFQFEKLVALTYRRLGYLVTRHGASPAGGIDLIIEMAGQQTAVQCRQCKTWNVGVNAVNEFLSALTHAHLQKGILISLRGYTAEALQLAEKCGIHLLKETELTNLLEATHARSDPEALALLCDTRKFCPRCESELILCSTPTGPTAGQKFWSCSAYPNCRYTLPA
jgi:HJR/Mrr/RecB family endonuclease